MILAAGLVGNVAGALTTLAGHPAGASVGGLCPAGALYWCLYDPRSLGITAHNEEANIGKLCSGC